MIINPPVVAALLAVYIFWGGTYLAMKFAIDTIPPLMMAGSRFVLAGGVLYLWELSRGTNRPTINQWKGALVVGGLMLLGGNGGVVWAEQMVPSGIAAIIVATVPLWMALLVWWQGGDRPDKTTAAGLILGFAGILLLVRNTGGASESSSFAGYLVLVLCSLSWAAGSLYSRKVEQPSAQFMAIASQMLSGGVLLLLLSCACGEWSRFYLANISLKSAFSFVYLVVFGSIIGYSAYIWLLKAADPLLVSTYAYVNPAVAVVAGWLLAGELLSGQDILATALIVLAVVIITKAKK